jgi:hypothetical protein
MSVETAKANKMGKLKIFASIGGVYCKFFNIGDEIKKLLKH